MLFTFGAGASPSASSNASSESGAVYTGAISAPVVNIPPSSAFPTGPGQNLYVYGGVVALFVFIGAVIYATRK